MGALEELGQKLTANPDKTDELLDEFLQSGLEGAFQDVVNITASLLKLQRIFAGVVVEGSELKHLTIAASNSLSMATQTFQRLAANLQAQSQTRG